MKHPVIIKHLKFNNLKFELGVCFLIFTLAVVVVALLILAVSCFVLIIGVTLLARIACIHTALFEGVIYGCTSPESKTPRPVALIEVHVRISVV